MLQDLTDSYHFGAAFGANVLFEYEALLAVHFVYAPFAYYHATVHASFKWSCVTVDLFNLAQRAAAEKSGRFCFLYPLGIGGVAE